MKFAWIDSRLHAASASSTGEYASRKHCISLAHLEPEIYSEICICNWAYIFLETCHV